MSGKGRDTDHSGHLTPAPLRVLCRNSKRGFLLRRMPMTDPLSNGNVLTAQRQLRPNVTENIPVVLCLRDHFAGLAMQALLPRQTVPDFREVASRAYAAADAMLEARK